MQSIARILSVIIFMVCPVFVIGQTIVSMDTVSANKGEQVSVSVYLQLEDGDQVSGIFSSFEYDTTFLSFVGIDDTNSIADSTVNAMNSTQGKLLFSMASTYPVKSSGVLFSLVFEAKEVGSTKVELVEYRVNENDPVSPGPSSMVKIYPEGGNQPPFIVDLPDTLLVPLLDTLVITLDEQVISDIEDAFEDLKFSFSLDPEVVVILIDEETLTVKIISLDYTGFATLNIVVEDTDGAILEASIVLDIRAGVGLEEEDEPLNGFSLSQNYPNPFNPRSTITYTVPEASFVRLTVYNLLGQPVASLIDGRVQAGTHRVEFNATGLSSGVYVYRMQSGAYTETRRMLLLK